MEKNVAKRKRNRGEELEYVNRSGETVPAVVFKDHECGCPLKCATKHSVSEQQAMFDLYWNSSRDFICGHVQQVPVKLHTNKQQSSRRQKTRIFYLAKQDLTAVRVCKQMFCNVQQVTMEVWVGL